MTKKQKQIKKEGKYLRLHNQNHCIGLIRISLIEKVIRDSSDKNAENITIEMSKCDDYSYSDDDLEVLDRLADEFKDLGYKVIYVTKPYPELFERALVGLQQRKRELEVKITMTKHQIKKFNKNRGIEYN